MSFKKLKPTSFFKRLSMLKRLDREIAWIKQQRKQRKKK